MLRLAGCVIHDWYLPAELFESRPSRPWSAAEVSRFLADVADS